MKQSAGWSSEGTSKLESHDNPMKRRGFLWHLGVFAGAGISAGCLGSDGDGNGDGTSSPISETTIRTNEAECASAGNQAVSINSRDGTVIVAGIITAPNPCHHAELAGAEYDEESDLLTVSVEAVKNEGSDACQECQGSIDYNAEVTFSDNLPGEVTVEHDGEEISAKAL